MTQRLDMKAELSKAVIETYKIASSSFWPLIITEKSPAPNVISRTLRNPVEKLKIFLGQKVLTFVLP